jgi:hypothetical protein
MHLDRLPGWITFLLLLAPCATSQKVADLPNPSLYFEPNLGQAIPETRYIAYRPGYRIELEDSAISFVFPPAIHDAVSKPGRALRLRWIIDQEQPHSHPERRTRSVLLGMSPIWILRSIN